MKPEGPALGFFGAVQLSVFSFHKERFDIFHKQIFPNFFQNHPRAYLKAFGLFEHRARHRLETFPSCLYIVNLELLEKLRENILVFLTELNKYL